MSTSSAPGAPAPWLGVTLGIVLMTAGIVVLIDISFAKLLSAMFIGFVAVCAGAYEIAHAFLRKAWGGFIWQIVLGALYAAFGLTLLTQPALASAAVTYVFGFMLVASGVVRLLLSRKIAGKVDRLLMLSGVVGIVAGIVIVSGWPARGLWILGLLLGVDLLLHGFAWLMFTIRAPMARHA